MRKPPPDVLSNALLLGPQTKRVRGYRDPLTNVFVIQIGESERIELPPDNAVQMAVGMLAAYGINVSIGPRGLLSS